MTAIWFGRLAWMLCKPFGTCAPETRKRSGIPAPLLPPYFRPHRRLSLITLRRGAQLDSVLRHLYSTSGVCNLKADVTEFKTRNQQYARRLSFAGTRFTRAVKFQTVPSRQKKLLHCCDRMALERKTEKMPTYKRTNWLLRPWIAGEISREPFLSKAEIPHPSVSSVLVSNKRYAELTKAVLSFTSASPPRSTDWSITFPAERKRVPSDVLRELSA